jgi:hypothetical protein
VDSIRKIEAELREAITEVALEHDLSPTWMNANAAPFIPATFDASQCDVLLEHPRLLVLGAPMRDVFVMKMYRAHPNDVDDMVAIWAQTSFLTAAKVVEAFFAAYPHAPADEHLDSFVIGIAERAGHALPRS